MHKKSFVGGVSDADCVHRHKPLWLLNAASGAEPPPTDFLRKAGRRAIATESLSARSGDIVKSFQAEIAVERANRFPALNAINAAAIMT